MTCQKWKENTFDIFGALKKKNQNEEKESEQECYKATLDIDLK